MSQQTEKEIKLYNGKAFGYKVSDYGLQNGYLDYYTLSKIVGDSILNNVLISVITSGSLLMDMRRMRKDTTKKFISIILSQILVHSSYKTTPTKLYITIPNWICTFGVLHISVQAGIMY